VFVEYLSEDGMSTDDGRIEELTEELMEDLIEEPMGC
jgi:hypothetical protein